MGEIMGLKEIHYGWMISVKENTANGWGGKQGPKYATPYQSC